MKRIFSKITNILQSSNKKRLIAVCALSAAVVIIITIVCVYTVMNIKHSSSNEATEYTGISPSAGGMTAASPSAAPTETPAAATSSIPDNAVYVMTGLDYGDGKIYKYEYKENSVILRNEEGGIVYYVKYDSDGNIAVSYGESSGLFCEYDADGRILKELYYSTPESGIESLEKNNIEDNLYEIYTYEYDGQHIKAITVTERSGETKRNIEFEYDAEGILTKKTEKSSYDTVEYTYDRSGNVLTEEAYRTNGMLISKREYTYDENGICSYEKSVTSPASANSYVNGYSINNKAGYTVEFFTEYNWSAHIGEYYYSNAIDEHGIPVVSDIREAFSNGYMRHTYEIGSAAKSITDIYQIEDIWYDINENPVYEPVIMYDKDESEYSIILPDHSLIWDAGKFYECTYDTKGNELRTVYYDDKSAPVLIKNTEYDISGKKLYESYFADAVHYGVKELIMTCRYTYDENGILSKISYDRPAYTPSCKIDYYFNNGRVSQCVINSDTKIEFEYTDGGVLRGKTVSYQKSAESVIIHISYSNQKNYIDTATVNTHHYNFDENKRKVREYIIGVDSSVENIYTFEYDENDRPVVYAEYDGNEKLVYKSETDYTGSYKESVTSFLYGNDGKTYSMNVHRHITGEENSSTVYENGTLKELYGIDDNGNIYTGIFEWIVPDNEQISTDMYGKVRIEDIVP